MDEHAEGDSPGDVERRQREAGIDAFTRWRDSFLTPLSIEFVHPDEGIATIPTLQPDLWPLIDHWRDAAERARSRYSHDGEPTLTGARIANAYETCADELAEVAGPRYFA